MSKYTEMKQRHQAEVNAFPMMFAFSNKQFEEGMKKLGLTENDTAQICSIGAGGYIRKTDKTKLKDMLNRHSKELQDAIAEDKTGDGFIYEMFLYELNNHEYSYTQDYEDTLNALGYTYEDLENDPRLRRGILKAASKIGYGEEW